MTSLSDIDAFIANNKIAVISKSYCPYCTKAKKALDKVAKGQYAVLEIENDGNCANIQAYMKKKTGGSSVPRVFVNRKFIGGGDDTVAKQKSGELARLLV